MIIGIFVLAGIFYFSGILGINGKGDKVTVYLNGEEYGYMDLANNDELIIENGKHKNVIEVEDGQVYMKEANCRDELCIRQGKISMGGQTVVCLPNKVVVEVISNDYTNEFDSIVQ